MRGRRRLSSAKTARTCEILLVTPVNTFSLTGCAVAPEGLYSSIRRVVPMNRRRFFRSAGLFGCSVLLSGCSATEPSLEELEVEMSNRTAEARRVGVQLEHQSEIIYSTTLRVDGRATVTRATGVTSHPLTVRATVDESFEDVAAYEWHGCTHDVISIYVNPQPEIISGCHDD